MIAYKGFHPGMVCIGYQFQMGLNVTKEANCRQNGFHCAEDPLDCLSYYSDVGRILRTFKIKKNVEVTDNGKIII